MLRASPFAFLLLSLVATVSAAENWPNWRGPDQNGVAPGKGFPTRWSATENVAWKFKLPGAGSSTPVVWGDKIFLTCSIEGKNGIVCLDRDGKQLWHTEVGTSRDGKHKKATGSNPSTVTDGEHVYAYFKSGDLACLDYAGKIVWQHNLQKLYGEDTLWWDLGTSPVLTKECVVVAVMQTGPSYLAAFDKKSGEAKYKADRNVPAPSEAAQAYSTPIVMEEGGREILVVLGADHVTGHEAVTGKEIWRVGGLNPKQEMYYRSIAGPVVTGGIVVAPYARGGTVTGVRLGGSGDVTATHVAWTRNDLGADVPTPAGVDGLAYVCSDKGEVTCIEAATGKTQWNGQLPKNRNAFSASPIIADGKIYLTREDGVTFVIAQEQGAEFKVLAENELGGELVVASPVPVDGRILIRTVDHLYCLGK